MSAAAATPVAAAPMWQPWWRRYRGWLLLAAAVAVGAIVVAAWSSAPGTPLDPASAHGNGSRALVHVLGHFGVRVRSTKSVDAATQGGAATAIVVAAPDSYSGAQLHRLAASAGRLVLVRPANRSLAALAPSVAPAAESEPDSEPGCTDPGAEGTGPVTFPTDTVTYDVHGSGMTSCYGAAVLTTPRLAILGSSEVLQNDDLSAGGVAALDVNTITAGRRLPAVTWLLPGPDAAGGGTTSVWDLFPSGAYRVFWWLAAVGVLLALWRGRRLGGVISEPLPVVVRAAELVEGHGRLYERAGARDRAAAALRRAAIVRLTNRLRLPRHSTPEQLAAAIAPRTGRSPADIVALLAGPAPADDAALVELARNLDALTTAASEGTAL